MWHQLRGCSYGCCECAVSVEGKNRIVITGAVMNADREASVVVNKVVTPAAREQTSAVPGPPRPLPALFASYAADSLL